MKKILSLILSGIALLSCAGCNFVQTQGGTTSNGGGTNVDAGYEYETHERASYTYADALNYENKLGSTHIYNVTEGTLDLVKDGTTNFVIVYPNSYTAREMTAVTLLSNYFAMATGINLQTMSDTQYVASYQNKNYISIGTTSIFKTANIQMDKDLLGTSGFIIKTDAKGVYLNGGKYAHQYAVQEFLYREFNFVFYQNDEVAIDTGVKNVKLHNMDIVDVPDFEYRMQGWGDQLSYLDMTRLTHFGGCYASTSDIPYFHNYMEILPPSVYGETHPNWYTFSNLQQVCLWKDPYGIINAIMPTLIYMLESCPEATLITFSQEDGLFPDYDGIDRHELYSIIDEYPELTQNEKNTLVHFLFSNELAKRLQEWVDANCPEREIYLVVMVYGGANNMPVQEDANGEPIVDENGNPLMLEGLPEFEDNLAALMCWTWNLYYGENTNSGSVSFEVWEDEEKKAVDDRKKFGVAVHNNFVEWLYSTHFSNYLLPYNHVQIQQDTIQYVYSYGSQYMYDMGQYNQGKATDWGQLKSYLQSKWFWDCQLDQAALIDDWFNVYFKDAAETMKQFYYDYTAYSAYLTTEHKQMYQRNQLNFLSTEYWSYQRLQKFLSYADQAWEDIKYLKYEDPELYDKLYTRILLETIPYQYMVLRLYPNTFEFSTQLVKAKAQFVVDCQRCGMTKSSEWVDITSPTW